MVLLMLGLSDTNIMFCWYIWCLNTWSVLFFTILYYSQWLISPRRLGINMLHCMYYNIVYWSLLYINYLLYNCVLYFAKYISWYQVSPVMATKYQELWIYDWSIIIGLYQIIDSYMSIYTSLEGKDLTPSTPNDW